MLDENRTYAVTFWEHSVWALAAKALPQFSGYSQEDVGAAFREIFRLYADDASAITAALARDVSEASGGKVLIEAADRNEFRTERSDPGAYLRLTADGQGGRLLFFGPSGTPFMWDEDR